MDKWVLYRYMETYIMDILINCCSFCPAFTVGFAEEKVTVHESSSGNKTVPIRLRVAKGNITEIPLIIKFTVDNSSTATPGKGSHYVHK